MIRAALALALLPLAACTYDSRPEPAPPAPPVEGACNAEPAQLLVGKKQNERVAKRALRLSGARDLRWIAPGQAVTMDYRTDRLNLETDAQGRIATVRCG